MRVLFFVWLSVCVLGTTVAAQATTFLGLNPSVGPPSTLVFLSGSGFDDNEAVDVYVDAVDTLVLFSSKTGTISGSITIAASATPGTQYLTAVGRHSGHGAQTSFTVTVPWLQLGYGAGHLSTNPWENVLSPATVSAIGPAWISAAGSMGAQGATVTVDAGVAYASTESNGIEAISVAANNGSLLWSFTPPDGSAITSSPTVLTVSNISIDVYVGSTNQTVYSLNPRSGAVQWSTTLDGPGLCGGIYSSAAVANGIVYIGVCNSVYALNAYTGTADWSYETGGQIVATPTVVNGVVYIGSEDGNVYAINATSGSPLWEFPTGGPVESTAAVANGVVYVGSEDDNVYAIQAYGQLQGRVLWSYTTGGPVYASPAVANDTVYVGSEDTNLYALSAVNGVPIWSYTTGSAVNSAAVANDVVYFTTEAGEFYAADYNGYGILASGITGGTSGLGSPSISDGVVYVPAEGGNVYAFALPPNLGSITAPLKAPPRPASLHPDLRLRISH